MMMARPWKAPPLLLAILVVLVAFSYQAKKKTFVSVQEVSAIELSVQGTLEYVTEAYNKESDDLYNFRILRILKIEKQITEHTELHIRVEMRRTTCFKTEKSNCDVQEGPLYKVLGGLRKTSLCGWPAEGPAERSLAPKAPQAPTDFILIQQEAGQMLHNIITTSVCIIRQIQCYFSVYVISSFEVYKILKKNCTDS